MGVTESDDAGPGKAGSEDDIRETVRGLTAQVLRGGKVDRQGVENVVRQMTAAGSATDSASAQPGSPEDRQALLNDLTELDHDLKGASEAAHAALAQIAARGMDFTENDLKEALVRLRDLQQAYVDTVSRVADAASGNVQRELRGLAGQAQQLSVDAGAQVAGLMSEFANRLNAGTRTSASSGFDAAFDYGVRMSSLASGVLAGIADGLRDHTGSKPDNESTR